MNVLVVDTQGLLGDLQRGHVRNRVRFSLTRFGDHLDGVTVHLVQTGTGGGMFRCLIHANVRDQDVVTIRRSAASLGLAVGLAADAAELKVSNRIDRDSWLNAERFSNWSSAFRQPFRWLFESRDLQNPC